MKTQRKVLPYFVLSYESGKEHSHGYLNELPNDIIEKIENGFMLSMWDISGKNIQELLEKNGRNHTSFAFNESCNELCVGDYV